MSVFGKSWSIRYVFIMKDRCSCLSAYRSYYHFSLAFAVPVLGATVGIASAAAQSITAASDGTGTVVTQSRSQFDITGGSFSADGINQFHSFDEFSVEAGQAANFVAEPAVQNVLARVSGGATSVID